MSLVRSIGRFAKHAPDRWLHSSRSRRARSLLATHRPNRLLVMCLGNICRSPYAAGVFARQLPGCEVRSAGFLESGRHSPREAVSVAAELGVNLVPHTSTRLTPELLDWADLVVVMDGWQERQIKSRGTGKPVIRLGDLDPLPIDTRTVMDPIDRPRATFLRVFRRIDRCCESAVTALTGATAGAGSRT